MEHLLFAAYLILFAWLITKIKFFTKTGLSNSQLIIIFLLKIMAGIFYGWIGVYYGELAKMLDTWAYHYESLIEYKLFLNDPGEFFASITRNTYEGGYSKFLTSKESWWNDLHGNFLIKTLAIFNVLSFGNYYINVIFFSFITFFGPIALYRVMINVFPTSKYAVLISTFLVPSFLYWTSGIHKDGLIFLGIALIVYGFYFLFKTHQLTIKRSVLILLGFLIVLIFRNYLIIIIIPAIIAWFAAYKIKNDPILVFSTIYLFFVIFFFTARYVFPKLDFPQAVATKQYEFMLHEGGSEVPVEQLEPTFKSFLVNTPQAFALAVIRPYPSDVKHLLSLAAAVEINFLLFLFLIFLVWRKNGEKDKIFILFCIFLSFSILITIGYTVNFLGAIVRYRSIVLPFLIVPLMAKIDWNRLGKVLIGDIQNKNNI